MSYIKAAFTSMDKQDFPRMSNCDFSVKTLDDMRRLVRYFGWVPLSQKATVAKNILKTAADRHVQIEVGPKHPLLEYVPRNKVIVKGRDANELYCDETRSVTDLFRGLLDNLTCAAAKSSSRLERDIRRIIYAKDDCIVTRYYNAWVTWNRLVLENGPDRFYTHHSINVINVATVAFVFMRRELVKMLQYDPQQIAGVEAQQCLIWDICDEMKINFVRGFGVNLEMTQSLRILCNPTTITVILNQLRELQLEMYNSYKSLSLVEDPDASRYGDLVDRLEMEILECSGYFRGEPIPTHEAEKTIQTLYASMPLPNTKRFLEQQKNKLNSQLDIIMGNERTTACCNAKTKPMEVSHYDLISTIPHADLSGMFPYKDVSAVTRIDRVVDMELRRFDIDPDHLTMFRGVYMVEYYQHFGILVRNKKDIGVLVLKDNERIHRTLNALHEGESLFKYGAVYFMTRTHSPKDVELAQLTEGIEFDADGNMRFSFKHSATLMDQYSTNHNMLMANIKAENWDGAKANLAVAFHLVNETEKILHGKKRKTEDIRKDAQRTRAFAMNDFKTYLPVITKHDPSFDFAKYFEGTDHGKVTFGVTPHDIAGVRKLLRMIVLG